MRSPQYSESLATLMIVNRRAILTRFGVKPASNIDHPKLFAALPAVRRELGCCAWKRLARFADGGWCRGVDQCDCAGLGLSRNTVIRALRSESRFEYRRSSQPRPKLCPFLETLEAWFEAEEKLPAREQRMAQRIYEALCLEGYTGAASPTRMPCQLVRSNDRSTLSHM